MTFSIAFLLMVFCVCVSIHWSGANRMGRVMRDLNGELDAAKRWRVARVEKRLRKRFNQHLDNQRIAGIVERPIEEHS